MWNKRLRNIFVLLLSLMQLKHAKHQGMIAEKCELSSRVWYKVLDMRYDRKEFHANDLWTVRYYVRPVGSKIKDFRNLPESDVCLRLRESRPCGPVTFYPLNIQCVGNIRTLVIVEFKWYYCYNILYQCTLWNVCQ